MTNGKKGTHDTRRALQDQTLRAEVLRKLGRFYEKDIVEEAYQKAWTSMVIRAETIQPTFKDRESARNYLMRAVARLSRRYNASAFSKGLPCGTLAHDDTTNSDEGNVHHYVPGSFLRQQADPVPNALDALVEEDRTAALREQLWAVIQGLPPAAGDIWRVLLHNDKTDWYKAIQAKYNCTYTSATMRIQRARTYADRFEKLLPLAGVRKARRHDDKSHSVTGRGNGV